MTLPTALHQRTPGGHTVVLTPRPGPTLAVSLRLDRGARDEADHEAGAAHLLEHMLFKGTATRGVGETAAAIERLGGDINAWTSHDEIVLHATVASGSLDDVLSVLADLVHGPRIDPAELVREREVVLEELAVALDDPSDRLGEALSAALWPDHPYGRPVLGSGDTVRGLDASALRAFLDAARSTPLTVVLCGDVDAHDAAAAVDRALGPAGTATRAAIQPPPRPDDGPLAVPVALDVDDRLVEIGWRGPDAPDDPDLAPLAVLAGMLGETSGDRLSEALDREPKAGFDAWSSLSEMSLGSTFSVGFRPLPGATATALGRVRALVDALGHGARGRQVGRARDTILADLDFAFETADGIADTLLHHAIRDPDPAAVARWRDRIAAVSPDAVTRAARRWLDPDRAVVGVVDPDLDAAATRAAWAPVARDVPEPDPDGILRTTVHGVPVWIAVDDAPVVAIRVRARGGWLRVAPRHAGLATAWARTLPRGAGPRDGEALFDALDELGAELLPKDGPDAVALSATAPAASALDLLDLTGDLVLDPHFEDAEWALVATELRDAVRTRSERQGEVLGDAMAAHRYPGHPWRTPAAGSLRTIDAITGRDLRRWHERQFARGGISVAIAGRVDPAEILDALDWLGDLPTATPPAVPATPAFTPGRVEVTAGRGTASVDLWIPAAGTQDPPRTRALWRLVEGILDGQAGRLFLEVREARGLVYDVHPGAMRYRDHGMLALSATCRPEGAAATEAALRDVLQGLVDHPPTADECARARAYLLGLERRGMQRVAARAAWMARVASGSPDDRLEPVRDTLEALNGADVADAVARALATGVIVGTTRPRGVAPA